MPDFKDLPTLERPCNDCGVLFKTQVYLGRAFGQYCQQCRDRRMVEQEIDHALRRGNSLAQMRREFIENKDWGIPSRYWQDEWEDFQFDRDGENNRDRITKLRDYAETFPVDGPPHQVPSLVLASPMNGVGKTMLASLILKTIISRYSELGREQSPFQFWSVNKLKMRLRTSERFGSKESTEDVYRDFASRWLLILDDVGKEQIEGRDANFAYEMYFNLLDQRYNNQLPIILTSNLNTIAWETDPNGPSLLELMGRAAVSRLMEMTGGEVYVIDGQDRRHWQ